MIALYWTLLIAGGGIIVAQAVLAAVGVGEGLAHDVHDAHDGHDGHAEGLDALHLLSLRTLSAAAAAGGLAGLAAQAAGWPAIVGAGVALIAAAIGAVVVAMLLRSLLRLQSDRSLRLSGAVGLLGHVYVAIPADGATPGKVMLTLQGRTVEVPAVARDGVPLPNGAAVLVIDRRDDGVFEVVPAPAL